MSLIPKPLILIILDGWGIAPPGPGNAISLSETPNMDLLWASYPHTKLEASGEAVGLPRGEDGNSETGHLNLGAGRIVLQDLPRINMSIADGTFFKNRAFLTAIEHVKKNHSTMHLLGLIGSGGVHSNLEHLFALLNLASQHQLPEVALHIITDGRDSPPTSAPTYVSQIESNIEKFQVGKIATVMGRFYAMDRDQRWERTQKAYMALTQGLGNKVDSAQKAIQISYDKGKTDEFIEPTIIVDKGGNPVAQVRENDAFIFFNFRIDRPRQLTKAFVLPDFQKAAQQKPGFDPYAVKYFKKHQQDPDYKSKPFVRGERIKNLFFVTMTEYEKGLPVAIAFSPQKISKPLGEILSQNSLKQLRIAETEKERFVTYYFNGLREDQFAGEDRIIIPSAKVKTYDLLPQMSAPEIAETIIEKIATGMYDVVIANFANPDMVAHTGNLQATIDACKVVDGCVGQIVEKALQISGGVIITADHGNAEELISPQTGEVDTEHSTFPVPFIYVEKSLQGKSKNLAPGVLADIAPTMIQLLHINKPKEMTGKSLL